ncbi:MAG: DNA-binding protein [Gammaproteobacteria bacterium]
MSRPGVTYNDIANAAQQLSAQGKNPTIESIRSLTGTGSSTTIAQHLKAWKVRQDQTKLLCLKENLPEEIVLTMKGLWGRVISQGEEKLMAITQDFEQTTSAFKEQNTKLEEENVRWQQQHHEIKQEKDRVAHDKSALEQVIRQLENEKIALTVTQENSFKQLQEKQDRINEIHRLNQQVQANLEHYREASREQRMLDQQRHEQAQVQLEQTVQQLKQELTAVKQERNSLQHELEKTRQASKALQNQNDLLTSQNETIKSRWDLAQKEVIQHSHAEQHWRNQCQKTQEKLDEQNASLISLQTQMAVLSQKLSDAQGTLKEVSEQNKFLAHEKWILGQENAQLIGQLTQLEKVIL